jgi:hypothetical protein
MPFNKTMHPRIAISGERESYEVQLVSVQEEADHLGKHKIKATFAYGDAGFTVTVEGDVKPAHARTVPPFIAALTNIKTPQPSPAGT